MWQETADSWRETAIGLGVKLNKIRNLHSPTDPDAFTSEVFCQDCNELYPCCTIEMLDGE